MNSKAKGLSLILCFEVCVYMLKHLIRPSENLQFLFCFCRNYPISVRRIDHWMLFLPSWMRVVILQHYLHSLLFNNSLFGCVMFVHVGIFKII